MLQVTGIAKRYGEQQVLTDISFQVNKGECLGIIGPNGSGKSTLLKMISGAEQPDGGQITLDGKPVQRYKAKPLARKMAVLPQEGILAHPVSVFEAVMMGRYPFLKWFQQEGPEDVQVVEAVMEETGITSLAEKSLDQLSGGERQRVAIARAMAQQPEMLVLDEPTTFLDIGYQMAILDVLKAWQRKRSATLILVLHDLNLASRYCDRLLLMQEGKVYKWGDCAEVMDRQSLQEIYGVSPVMVEHPVLKVPQIIL